MVTLLYHTKEQCQAKSAQNSARTALAQQGIPCEWATKQIVRMLPCTGSATRRGKEMAINILTYALCDAVVKRIRDALGERCTVIGANRKALASWANRRSVYLLNVTRDTSLLTVFIEYHVYFLLWPLRRKVVVYFSTDYVDLCKSALGKAIFYCLNRLVFACARLVVLLPHRGHIARRYKLPPERVLYAENYPAPEFCRPQAVERDDRFGGKTVFLYHGSFLWWHGLPKFLPIYERIKESHPQALLVVMGSVTRNRFLDRFAYEREFFDQVEALRRRDDIVWVPRSEVPDGQVARVVAQAAFHVSQLDNTSVQGDTELRTCLLEAMALGLPCLHVDSHAIRAHPEFKDGDNIVIIDPGDPDAAGHKIGRLIENPAERERIGENAKRTIQEHYDFDRWMETTLMPRLRQLAEE